MKMVDTSKLKDMSKQELIELVFNLSANRKQLSKLYLDKKVEFNFLFRTYKIMERRFEYLKKEWEKKNKCKLTFVHIDNAAKHEEMKIKRKKSMKGNENGNTKN